MELISLGSGGWFPQNPRWSIQDKTPTSWLTRKQQVVSLVNSPSVFIMHVYVCQLYIIFGRCHTHCTHTCCLGVHICLCFLWDFLLGLDKLNSQHAIYSLGFLFLGLQVSPKLMIFCLLGVCLQPNTMVPLRPSQCVQTTWQVKNKQTGPYSICCLTFICQYWTRF